MNGFEAALSPSGDYHLAEPRLELCSDKLLFHAQLCGPVTSLVWARAWLSDASGTLSETAVGPLSVGETTIAVPLPQNLVSARDYLAAFRLESAPLQTEHVLTHPLQEKEGRLVTRGAG